MKSLVQGNLSRSEGVFTFDSESNEDSDEDEENLDEEEDGIADSDEDNCNNDVENHQIIWIKD